MKNLSNIYIPDAHKKYNVLPHHRKYNEEMFVWDDNLLRKIEKYTKMINIYPYYRYKTYQNFYKVINEWIKKFPGCEQDILNYKNSLIKLNNKDNWAIVQYTGKSDFDFTTNNHYYVVMYKENNCYKIYGIIDNEEYNAFESWNPKCTNPLDLIKDLKIIIDPSNNLKNEFSKIMKEI